MAWAWCIVRRSKHKFTRTNWTCCSMNRSKQMIWNRRWSDDLFYYWILLCQSIVVQFSTMFFFFFVHLFGMLACMFAFQMKVHNLTSTSNQVHRNILSKKCCFFTFFFPLLSFCLRFFLPFKYAKHKFIIRNGNDTLTKQQPLSRAKKKSFWTP